MNTQIDYETRRKNEIADNAQAHKNDLVKLAEVARLLNGTLSQHPEFTASAHRAYKITLSNGADICIHGSAYGATGKYLINGMLCVRKITVRDIYPRPVSVDEIKISQSKTAAQIASEIARRYIEPNASVYAAILARADAAEAYRAKCNSLTARFESRVRACTGATLKHVSGDSIGLDLYDLTADQADKVLAILEAK